MLLISIILLLAKQIILVWTLSFFKNIFLEDIDPFLWDQWHPVLDFRWHLSWVSTPKWIPLLVCFIAYVQWIPQIRLWCDTCWPLGGHHWTLIFLLLFHPQPPGKVNLFYHAIQHYIQIKWTFGPLMQKYVLIPKHLVRIRNGFLKYSFVTAFHNYSKVY